MHLASLILYQLVLKRMVLYQQHSKIASHEEFSLLQKHVRHIYEDAGNKMVEGDVGITPYKLKDRTPCTFCSFKSVCQFDQSLEDNQYRNLADKKQKEVLEILRGEEKA